MGFTLSGSSHSREQIMYSASFTESFDGLTVAVELMQILLLKLHFRSLCRYRLSFGCNDKLQLGSLISAFAQARSAVVAAAK